MTITTIKEKARLAGCVADVLGRNLLAASTTAATPAEVRSYLETAYQAFGYFTRIMADLERLAPNSAAAGYEVAEALRHAIEVRQASVEARDAA